MKIDLLIGENPYNSTSYFAKKFSEALERHGIKTRLFWVGEGHFFHAYYEISADPPDLTCSFSDISLNGQSLGNLWQIPHLSILVDPAIYFLHQLRGEYSWISCVDESECDFVRSLNFSRVFHLPHAAPRDLQTPPNRKRPYDVVFFGSCVEWEPSPLVLEAAKRVLIPNGLSILEALLELGVKEEDLARLHYGVDMYVRGKDRVEILKRCPNVHIWGEGPWERHCPHATVHPSIPFEKTLEIMKEAKIVVNSSPRFKSGSHERIFHAPMCGACVLTAENPYVEGLTYQYGEWEIDTFDGWQELAEKGQEKVLSEHTWDHRAEILKQLPFSRF